MVKAYLERQKAALQSGDARVAEIRRLYKVMLERRKAAATRIPDLVENGFLFPVGSGE
jgi:hypothetical protein